MIFTFGAMKFANWMKRLKLLTLVFYLAKGGYGQTLPEHTLADTSTLILKKGIYLSFADIRADVPSRSDSFLIKERTSGDIFLVGGSKYGFELVPEDKKSTREIRRQFVGISNGAHFYLSDRITLHTWQGMSRCLLSGPYVIADVKGSAAPYTGGGVVSSMIAVNSGYIIGLKDSSCVPLTRKSLTKLLSKYPDIAKNYQNKMDILQYTIPILAEINQKEKD
jgi:hypothetical protein